MALVVAILCIIELIVSVISSAFFNQSIVIYICTCNISGYIRDVIGYPLRCVQLFFVVYTIYRTLLFDQIQLGFFLFYL